MIPSVSSYKDEAVLNERLQSKQLHHCVKKGIFSDHVYVWSTNETEKIDLQQIFSDFHPVYHTSNNSFSIVLKNKEGTKRVIMLLAQKPQTVPSLIEMAFPIAVNRLLDSSDVFPMQAQVVGNIVDNIFAKRNEKNILKACEEDLSKWSQQIWDALLKNQDSKEVDEMIIRYFESLPHMLELLYGIGKAHTVGWFCFEIGQYLCKLKYMRNEINYPLDCVISISKVLEEFLSGQPEALLGVADLATSDTGWGSIAFQEISALDNPHKRFAIIEKLAHLQIKIAMKGWVDVYDCNKLSKGHSEKKVVQLSLSIQERLEGLRNLALAGSWNAQQKLLEAYYYNRFTLDNAVCNLTDKERIEGFKAIEREEGKSNKFHYLIACFYEGNGIPGISLNMTLDERLACLKTRALRGDEYSLRALMQFYLKGKLGEDACSLSLRERYKQFEDLKEINPSLWNDCYANAIMDSSLFSDVFQSEQEKFSSLFDFLEKHQKSFSAKLEWDIFFSQWFRNLPQAEKTKYLLKALHLGSEKALERLQELPSQQELISIFIAHPLQFKEKLKDYLPQYQCAIDAALLFTHLARHIKWQTIHFQNG